MRIAWRLHCLATQRHLAGFALFYAGGRRFANCQVNGISRCLGNPQLTTVIHCHASQLVHLVRVADGTEAFPGSQKPETQTYVQKSCSAIAPVIRQLRLTTFTVLRPHFNPPTDSDDCSWHPYRSQTLLVIGSVTATHYRSSFATPQSMRMLMHFPFVSGMVMIMSAMFAAVLVFMGVHVFLPCQISFCEGLSAV